MDNFVIQIDSLIDLTKEQRKGVEDAVDLCLVHNTPVHPPKIEKPAQAAKVVAAHLNRLDDFVGSAAQHDDITRLVGSRT